MRELHFHLADWDCSSSSSSSSIIECTVVVCGCLKFCPLSGRNSVNGFAARRQEFSSSSQSLVRRYLTRLMGAVHNNANSTIKKHYCLKALKPITGIRLQLIKIGLLIKSVSLAGSWRTNVSLLVILRMLSGRAFQASGPETEWSLCKT